MFNKLMKVFGAGKDAEADRSGIIEYFQYKDSFTSWKNIYEIHGEMDASELNVSIKIEKFETKKGGKSGKTEYELTKPKKVDKVFLKEEQLNVIHARTEGSKTIYSVFCFIEDLELLKSDIEGKILEQMKGANI